MIALGADHGGFYLKEAVKNPTGVAGQYLAKQLFQDDIISSLDAQTEKLLAKDIDFWSTVFSNSCSRNREKSSWIIL